MTRSQLRLWSPSSSPASPCVTAQSARGRASSAARPRAGAFAGERLQQHAASGCLDHLLCCALLLCRRPARELIMRPRARARGRAPACEAWHCEPSRLRHTRAVAPCRTPAHAHRVSAPALRWRWMRARSRRTTRGGGRALCPGPELRNAESAASVEKSSRHGRGFANPRKSDVCWSSLERRPCSSLRCECMKAAERERNKQKRTRIDDDVDQLRWTMACVLIRYGFIYCEPATVPLAVRARMHLVCSVCSMRLYFNEVIFQ